MAACEKDASSPSIKERKRLLKQRHSRKPKKGIKGSVMNLNQIQPVSKILKDWGVEPKVGHSFFRGGVLCGFEDKDVDEMATEMRKVIERTRTETMSNFQKLIDEAGDENDEDCELDPAQKKMIATRSGQVGTLLGTGQDELETIGVIQFASGKKEFRRKESFDNLGQNHRRAATLSIAWTKPKDLKTQVSSEVNIFKEALSRMKESMGEMQSASEDKEGVINSQNQNLLVLEAMVVDMKDHLEAVEEELTQRDAVISDLNGELDAYKENMLGMEEEIEHLKEILPSPSGTVDNAFSEEHPEPEPETTCGYTEAGETVLTTAEAEETKEEIPTTEKSEESKKRIKRDGAYGENFKPEIIDIEYEEELIMKIKNDEAKRYAVMLTAMQEQLEYERRHLIGLIKGRDEAIQTLKNNTFKKNLEVLAEEKTGWFF